MPWCDPTCNRNFEEYIVDATKMDPAYYELKHTGFGTHAEVDRGVKKKQIILRITYYKPSHTSVLYKFEDLTEIPWGFFYKNLFQFKDKEKSFYYKYKFPDAEEEYKFRIHKYAVKPQEWEDFVKPLIMRSDSKVANAIYQNALTVGDKEVNNLQPFKDLLDELKNHKGGKGGRKRKSRKKRKSSRRTPKKRRKTKRKGRKKKSRKRKKSRRRRR